jgi:hypothetical protein
MVPSMARIAGSGSFPRELGGVEVARPVMTEEGVRERIAASSRGAAESRQRGGMPGTGHRARKSAWP